MFTWLSTWLNRLTLRDGGDRRQAEIFQILLVAWLFIATLAEFGMWIPLLTTPQQTELPPGASQTTLALAVGLITTSSVLLWITPLVALIILRRGYFGRSVRTGVNGIMLAHTLTAYASGVSQASVAVMFAIPILFAGLLGGRRLLLTISGFSIFVALAVGILQMQSPPLAGFLTTVIDYQTLPLSMGFICGVIILETVLLERFGVTFRQSLNQALEREAQLEVLRDSLEQTVSERTAELSTALNEVQTRAAEQAELLEQIEQQQQVIRELSIPVLPVSEDTLVIPLVGSMDSARILNLQQQALQAVERSRARTLILDVTGVALIDSQVAQGLIQTMQAAKLIGAEVALVGIRPEVAQTMVGLGIQLNMIRTYSSLHAALSGTIKHIADGRQSRSNIFLN